MTTKASKYLALLPKIWLLVIVSDGGSHVESRCAPSPSIQELLISQPFSARVAITGYLNDQDKQGLDVNCERSNSDGSEPAIVQILEVFKGSEEVFPLGSEFVLYWLTDTGYRKLPSPYEDSVEGFLVFPQDMDSCVSDTDTTIMSASECSSAGNIPWSEISQDDIDSLYSRSDYRTDSTLLSSFSSSSAAREDATNATTAHAEEEADADEDTDALQEEEDQEESGVEQDENAGADQEEVGTDQEDVRDDGNTTGISNSGTSSEVIDNIVSAATFVTRTTLLDLSVLLAMVTMAGYM